MQSILIHTRDIMGANKKTAKQLARATHQVSRARASEMANRAVAASEEPQPEEPEPAATPALLAPRPAPPAAVVAHGVTATRLAGPALPLAGERIASFASLTALTTRHGAQVPAPLVAGCVASLGGAAVRPSPVQAETWGWLLSAAPPDLIAISSTGSGKTLAFLLPALAEALAKPAEVAPPPAPPPPPVAPPAAAEEGADAAEDGGAEAQQAADAAMRAAATEAFKRAVAAGAAPDEAKAQARKAGKAAWKAARRSAAAAAAAAAGAAAAEGAVAAPAVLVLAPTRELCQQTAETAALIARQEGARVATACVVGGVDYARQRDELRRAAPQLLVATPGRLLSLCGETPASSRARQAAGSAPPKTADEPAACRLSRVALLVLDEADRLLEMGFEEDLAAIRRLVAPPPPPATAATAAAAAAAAAAPWTLMFSATWTARTAKLAKAMLAPGAVHVTVGGEQTAAAASVSQRVEVLRARGAPRMRRLVELLHESLGSAPPPGAEEAEEEEGEEEGEEEEEEEEGEEEGEEEAGEEAAAGEEDAEAAAAAAAAAAAGGEAAGGAAGGGAAGEELSRVIVFCVFKKQAKDVARLLAARGFAAAPLHGDMGQGARAHAVRRRPRCRRCRRLRCLLRLLFLRRLQPWRPLTLALAATRCAASAPARRASSSPPTWPRAGSTCRR